ncbi:MAG: hypothetical protein ACLUVX_08720 [Lachnospira pectinoschiza]
MRRNNLLKAGVLTLVLTLAIGMTACGKKNNTVKNNDTTVTQENVTTADKNNTKKSSKVVFDYTDADGVTTKLEGNATVSDNGEATIEVVDSNGNKAVFTGKASTDNGKLSVSDIKIKDASTLVKTDGTEVKVSEDAKIEDATESTEATKADVVTKEEPKEDTIVADGSDSNVSEGNENAGDNGADNGNVSDTPSNVETPDVPNTPSEPEYVPDVPSEPEPTPEEPQPSEPEEQAKTPVYCDMDFRTSDGVEDTRDATVGEYIFKKYINGEITESEAESLMLNGALINVKVRYDDGSEEIIDEIKPKSVKMYIIDDNEDEGVGSWHIPGYTYVGYPCWSTLHAEYYILIYYDI